MQQVRNTGFTLIELSIVLVIIGLIVGGVLVGRDLIQVAELHQAVNDLQELTSMIGTFQMKYDCLPGNCSKATLLFSDCAPDQDTPYPNHCNGAGDNMYGNTPYRSQEGSWRLYEHLRLGGFTFHTAASGQVQPNVYSVPGTNVPDLGWLKGHSQDFTGGPVSIEAVYQYFCPHTTNGCEDYQLPMIFNQVQANRLIIAPIRAGDPTDSGMFWLEGGIDAYLASTLDTKIDDGKPLTGRFRAYENVGSGYNGCTPNHSDPNEDYIVPSGYCPVALELPSQP